MPLSRVDDVLSGDVCGANLGFFFLLYIDIDLVQLLIEAEGLTSPLLPGQYAEDGPKIGGLWLHKIS
jgi:hypothetical protein